MRILKLSCSAENVIEPFELFNIQFVAKYQKKIEGGAFGDIEKLTRIELLLQCSNMTIVLRSSGIERFT